MNNTKLYFSDLTDTQKQNLADKLLNDHPLRLQNSLVEYVLSKSIEDTDAPFCFDDITNHNYTGYVEIFDSNGNSYYEELTESERDTKLEFIEHLKDRIDLVIDTLNDRISDLEDDQIGTENEEYALLQGKIDKLEERLEKAEQKQYNLDNTIDSLNDMDFDQAPEIYQWFSCSDWLIRKLEDKGQCTLDNEFWGRQCCGQSVTLDHVIREIAFEYFCDYGENFITLDKLKDLKIV